MKSDEIIDKLESLPLDERKEVLDFIEFLSSKRKIRKRKVKNIPAVLLSIICVS